MELKVKKRLISVVASVCLFSINLQALTLKESVLEALDTNPIVQERLKNFNETQQDLEITKSEWLPSLDYRATFGRNEAGNLKDETNESSYNHNVIDEGYNHYTQSLKLTQNIFNGFSTTHKIDYQKARILGAAHHYLENANDIAFQMVGAYLDVVRSYQLLQNAKDNVVINEKIYKDVQSLYDQGLTTKSEMTKIYASLSLAKSNLVVQKNNSVDKEFRFKRLLGRDADISSFTLPALNYAMPESKERATMYAIQNNPSILVSNFNIKGAQALYKEKKSKFYPTVDLEVEQVFNDVNRRNNFDMPDDRLKAYVVLSWNLYKGGAHTADVQKSKSTINKEVELQRDLKRQTIEGLELSWSAYEMLGQQLEELYKYYEYSQETLDSYQSEYEMGRRTLLDLLSAQNDLVNSKSQIINAQMDKLFAQYRILDAMGLLVNAVVEDEQAYDKIVSPTLKPFEVVKDELPVKLDVDNDGIVDSLDICDNSKNNDDIAPYGCSQKEEDSDLDGVPNSKDKCPETVFGATVDANGCEVENSVNRFTVNKEDYLNSVIAYSEQSPKKSNKLGLYDYEFNVAANKNIKSTPLDNHLMYDNFALIKRFDFVNMDNFDSNDNNISEVAKVINKYKDEDIKVTVIGHTQAMEDKEESYNKAASYAKNIKDELVKNGVNKDVLIEESRVDYDKAFLETNRGDKTLNNVVAIALYVPKKAEKVILDDDKDGVINELDKCPNTPAGYTVDENGCTNKINLEVLFENNSAVVKEDTKEKVLAFAKYLNDNKEFNTVITGHASKDKSSASYNQKLSEKRANAIKDLLVANGVESSRIQAIGKGFDEPIASNDTAEGQALNRRIEAELIKVKK
ncbi:MAG: TolC family outer membrane protein [Arcobacter sp.]|jgi:adhesin transport system outer membrane protein|uniref:TolC family outer membrane protein n=1 Tax=Arcobacter sp. TaxID=1872629 RepID=UPI002A75332E|nr:TolC family outer membrane protein [Arcobacter sp.]MDY3200672.1 TolC family outer membrane protein [Arcobacter sp.]